MSDEVYLDWNATTPPHPEVLSAIQQAAATAWANPSSIHGAGRRARALVEQAREELAALLTVHPRDVIFTGGGTEANNLALRAAPTLITSRLEHPSVTRVAEALENEGKPVIWLRPASSGEIYADTLERALTELATGPDAPPPITAIAAVNHETGVLQPLDLLADVVHSHRGWLHSDIVQGFGKLPQELWAKADSVAIAGHKLRGPRGIGALAWRRPWLPNTGPGPVMLGGAQERGLRPGTQDTLAIAGFQAAFRRVSSGPERYAPLAVLRDDLELGLKKLGATVNGADAARAPHVSNVALRGWKGDELVAALDLRHIRVSSGSACSAGTTEPSPVSTAMGGAHGASQAIRISLGETTTPSEIAALLNAIEQLSHAANQYA